MSVTMDEPQKLFTTGDIARLIGVKSDKLVRLWIDEGLLPPYHLPHLKERKVHRDDLRRFLLRYKCYPALRELDVEEGIQNDYPDPWDEIPPDAPPEPPPKKKPKPRK